MIYLGHIELLCWALLFLSALLICIDLHLLLSLASPPKLLLLYRAAVFVFNFQSLLHLLRMKLTVDSYFASPADSLGHLQLLERESQLVKGYFLSVLLKIFEEGSPHQPSTSCSGSKESCASAAT